MVTLEEFETHRNYTPAKLEFLSDMAIGVCVEYASSKLSGCFVRIYKEILANKMEKDK